MADDIVGSVGVSVVPDARDFWRRFEEQTRAGADKAGANAGKSVRRSMQAEVDRGVDVRVNADTTRARAQIAALNREADRSGGALQNLVKAAITLAPAVTPIAGAASAAAAEFGVLGVTGLLAIKGLKDEFRSATPEGERLSDTVAQFKATLDSLSGTAAHGVLDGLEQGADKLQAVLPQVAQVVAQQSEVLGQTVSNVVGGLAGGFKTFSPVLDEVSLSVEKVTARFESWATGPGGSSLATALAQDYRQVAPLIDSLATTVAHLAAASNPIGSVLVDELTVASRVVSSFPTAVLEAIVAGFVSFRAARAASTGITAISGALTRFDSTFTRFAARRVAASAAIEASARAEAAAEAQLAAQTATAQAEIASSFAASQRAIAESALGTQASLTGLAATAVQAAEEEAAAFQAAAATAVASAEEISAAAAAAAEESAAAGEAAAVGWSSMLGPLAAVGLGVGLFAAALGKGNEAEQQFKSTTSELLGVLQQTKGAINDQVVAMITQKLAQTGVYDAASKYGLKLSDVTQAALGNEAAQKRVAAATDGNFSAINKVLVPVKGLSGGLSEASHQYQLATGQLSANTTAAKASATTHQTLATVLGATSQAYRDARSAAKSSADESHKQTLQWQIENNAGQLLSQTLDKLAGKNLSFAQAQNQFQQQLVTLAQSLSQGGSALRGLSSDAITNRSNLLQLVQAAEQAAGAYGDMKGSSLAGRQELVRLRKQIIDNAVAHGEDRGQVEKYIDSVLKIPSKAGTTLTLRDAEAKKQARDLVAFLNSLDAVVHVSADGRFDSGGTTSRRATFADGGLITSGTGPRSDDVVIRASRGEYVVNAAATAAHLPVLDAINSGARGYADGGIVTLSNHGKGSSSASGSSSSSHTTYVVEGQSYASLQAATNAAKRLLKAQVALSVKIDDKDLKSFRQSLKGTVDQARSAFQNLLGDAKKLGISKSLAATLANENKRLDSAINDRNKLKDKLATLQQEFADVRNSVRDAAAGSFDVTSAGTGFDGQQPITFANIQAQATQAKNVIQKWAAGIKKLGSEGFNDSATGKAMLRDLATRGPSDYPEVQALLSASPKQLTDLIATDRTIVSTGAGLGTYIGQDLYGSQITAAKREIKVDEKSIDRIATKMGHQVTKAVKLLADRPINVYANGREILKVVQEEEKKQGRRN